MTEIESLLKDLESLDKFTTDALYTERFNLTAFENLGIRNHQMGLQLKAAILKTTMLQNELLSQLVETSKQLVETSKQQATDLLSINEDVYAIRKHHNAL